MKKRTQSILIHIKSLSFSYLPVFYILILSVSLFACKISSSKQEKYEPTFSQDSSGKKILIFGIPNLSSYNNSAPFIKYLNRFITNAQIRIVASTDADDYLEKIKNKYFDFTITNGPILLSAEQNGYSVIAKMGNDENYKAVIFVRNDSGINTIADLKGKTMATSSIQALAGTMMPLLYLYKNGLDVNKDIKHLYTPSFESAIMNVYLGKCSAGASKKSTVVNTFKQRSEIASKLSIKWETPSLINNAVLIRNDIDKTTKDELLRLILAVHYNEEGKKALEFLDGSKFEKADSNTYKPLRDFLEEYKTFIH